MSYYIGATGEYIWEELLENTTSNVIIANNINFDAGPLTDAIQETITDALGTAVGELIAPVTEVPSATGVGVVALTALGLLSYYKLNRTAVQDVDSMVYSADYASILTPGMFDDRVRIRYDNEWFSNAIYYEGGVKKGEILTYRPEQGSNILNLDATNIKLGTINNARLPTNYGTQLGIGTSPAVNTNLHIYNEDSPTIRLEAGANGLPSIEFQRGATNDVNVDFKIVNDTGRLKFLSQDEVDTYQTPASEIMRMTRTQLSIYENTEINGNLLLQSVAEGTPTVEFRRGTVSDVNKDYRFISQSDIFKLQFQDTLTYYGDANNQLISINDTDTIIHKQTEFKANVLIGGDTRTVGYVGIGTTAATPLHIYTAAANILRLQTAPVNGTNSIEFMRGNSTDPLTDYRILTDTGGKFKIQYANNLLAYGATDTDLIDLSTTNTIIYKPTEFKGNVGIGTAPHATYKVDVNGTTQSTAFIGNGAGLTDLGADKITTGSLNLDRITLTTSKLYQNFNQINFAIIDDKIDLPPNYSFNITDYDSQTLFNPSTERKYKGKITANYDDRNGVYKLITTNNRTDNVAVLNYKVGDKISIRNTAIVANDYLLESGGRYWNSLLLIKRPNNIPLNWAVPDPYSVLLYEWMSNDGLDGRPEARVRTPTNRYFPFTTVMTFLIEAGFNYYLCKLYNTVEVVGGSIIVAASGYGDDYNDFNRAFGAGQTFKLQITGSTFADDYLPTEYIGADIGIASDRRLGGVKKGRGVAIDETTGTLDAIPISSDLITNMNTSHFTNNTGTNKIDISSTYVAPSATKLATARNIAGTAFDGTANIDITYANLTNKPSLFSGSYSDLTNKPSLFSGSYTDLSNKPTLFSGSYTDLSNKPTIPAAQVQTDWNATTGMGQLLNKPTLFSGSYTDLTNKPTIPAAQINSDWNATTGLAVINNKPTLFSGSYTDLTNKPTIPAAQINSDWNATTGLAVINNKPSIPPTPTSTNLISVFNTTQFVNNTTTNKIDIDVNWKPTTCSIADSAMQLVSSRNIAGVGFNGTTSIAIPYFNLDFKPTAGTGISITTGSSSSSPVISATPTSANMIGIFNTSQFTNNTGTSKIDILSTWKPSGAVLADTATALATSRNIAGVAFNGTADIAIDYFALTNRPIILQPTTTNLQVVSGYTLSVPGNMAVGTTSIPTNILQVGAGGRLRIANGATDYTLLGTLDTDGSTNTSIVISGNTRSNNAGNIQYIATASGGSHIFYTSSPITTRMTISSSGVNVNNDLGVTGNVGVGVAPSATYKLNVNGSLNATSVLVNGSPVGGGLSQGMTVQTKHLTYTQMDVKNTTGWDAINDNLTTGFVIAITPSSASSKILVNMIAHIGTSYNTDSRWWGIKLYRKIGAGGAWAEITGANGTETGAAAATAGTPVWVSHNLGSSGADYQYFVANLTGTYLDNPNTTSIVYYTAYWNSRIGNINEVNNGIFINRAENHGDAYRPAPSSSWTATEIWDLGTPYVPPVGDNTITITSGNVGVGVAPNASYKLNVGGTINATSLFINGSAFTGSSQWTTSGTTINYPTGNVGIGNTTPLGTLHLGDASKANNDGHIIFAKCTTLGSTRICRVGYNNSFDFCIGDTGGNNTLDTWKEQFKINYQAPANSLVINSGGGINTPYNITAGNINCNSSYVLGTEVYARNSYDTRIRSDNGGMYLEMGYIGSAGDLLKIGAFNSNTEIVSGSARSIWFRTNGFSWVFSAGGASYNGYNVSYWGAACDHRIKENIKKSNLKMCYDNVKNINLYRYNYIDGFKRGTQRDKTQLGFIAQQVQQHFPKSVSREKMRFEDKREIPDLATINIDQVNMSLFGAVKQLIRVVEKQSKRIKKLEEMLNIVDDDEVEDDADEPYTRINCEDEVDIDDIEPSEHVGV